MATLCSKPDYRDGKLNGTITYWNLFGERTQEVYYVNGAPHGWAHFMSGKLFEMRQERITGGPLPWQPRVLLTANIL